MKLITEIVKLIISLNKIDSNNIMVFNILCPLYHLINFYVKSIYVYNNRNS